MTVTARAVRADHNYSFETGCLRTSDAEKKGARSVPTRSQSAGCRNLTMVSAMLLAFCIARSSFLMSPGAYPFPQT